MNEAMRAKILKFSAPNASGCWLWTSAVSPDGYGLVWVKELKRCRGAHRMAYLAWGGEIADGFEIDHLCRVRHCVNPEHLEAVPPLVNSLRSESPMAINARKTHCIRGHPFSPENTIYEPSPNGRFGRRCRVCRSASNARADKRRKAIQKARRAASREEEAT